MITTNNFEVISLTEFDQFFEEVCVGEMEIVDELVQDLQREGQELVDTILSSFKNEDLPLLQRAAHTLKSSIRIFGGIQLSNQAAEIEFLANPEAPGDFGTVSNAVSQIQENFNNFLLHLDATIASKRH
jgi:HPt (histidine-containing phosphotransfer) domain-containing protein